MSEFEGLSATIVWTSLAWGLKLYGALMVFGALKIFRFLRTQRAIDEATDRILAMTLQSGHDDERLSVANGDDTGVPPVATPGLALAAERASMAARAPDAPDWLTGASASACERAWEKADEAERYPWIWWGGVLTLLAGQALIAGGWAAPVVGAVLLVQQLAYFYRRAAKVAKAPSAALAAEAAVNPQSVNGFRFLLAAWVMSIAVAQAAPDQGWLF
jgi:hypothetical protein